MDAKQKRRVAIEWLIFLGSVICGGTIIPVIIMAMFAPEIKLGPFYEALFINSSGDRWAAWLVLLAPYVLVQVGRSVVWAYRTLKENASS